MQDLKRLNVRVRPEMHEWLQRSAEARGLTINAMVIFAIETYAQQQEGLMMLPDILERLKQVKD